MSHRMEERITQTSDDDYRETLWSGEVTLPGNQPPDRFRLVVKEYERFHVDQGTQPTGGRPAMVVLAPTDRRLVYADVLRFA